MNHDATTAELQRVREELVLRHVQGENDRDVEAVMATFTHPRYEIVPTGMVFDGDEAVREMIRRQWAELPPVRYSAEAIYHGVDGLIVETRTTAPGTSIDMLSINVFGFDGAGLILERCYFDRLQVAEQLGLTAR
ncbi:nuclear transport factor 2 family protein [Mycolicibacterium sp. 018/SC-01/001]|uniref:nuclear transport factor 2 family protein n=1 Tax=Mycolicibacterium sp. 018/SC-01/001 TaxID=2592069 RepID=UPI00117E9001|nr:nuclear transport factor 2 family protein [Mycolicibacterium sp. 018/SC-01/001]TRW79630.1 nuclear transport factor 2 family protein [Mycolicibacterium sp. 018/SC-01/001]